MLRSCYQAISRRRNRCLKRIKAQLFWVCKAGKSLAQLIYGGGPEAQRGLDRYFRFYNTERRHPSLLKKTPHEAHFALHVAAEVYRHQQEVATQSAFGCPGVTPPTQPAPSKTEVDKTKAIAYVPMSRKLSPLTRLSMETDVR